LRSAASKGRRKHWQFSHSSAAAEDVPVLITGETGTGKDLVATAIHKKSQRKNAPYLALNMGAIAPS